jgi:hypothetical protein
VEHGEPGSARVDAEGIYSTYWRCWMLNSRASLDAVTRVAKEYPGVHLLMSQPGVGAVTALAFVLTLGDMCIAFHVASRSPGTWD